MKTPESAKLDDKTLEQLSGGKKDAYQLALKNLEENEFLFNNPMGFGQGTASL